MKTAKLIISIISIVLFILIAFQSCAAVLGTALSDNSNDASGGAGLIVAFCMLIAGIVGIVAKNSKGACVTSGILFLFAAIIGFTNDGYFADLTIWSALAFIFGAFFIISSAGMKKVKPTDDE